MTLLPKGLRVHLAVDLIDMRKGIDGLAMLVQGVLRQDPFAGHLFVFRGRKANLIKIVYWDGTGLCLFTKRLEQGTFPDRPIAKGLASPALLAHVLTAKYCDHLPLYRQSQIFARHGVELDRSTLANWVGGAVWWLEPLHARLAEHVFASSTLFADDTPIPVLDPGRGRTKTGRLWVYARDARPWNGPDPPAADPSVMTHRPSLAQEADGCRCLIVGNQPGCRTAKRRAAPGCYQRLSNGVKEERNVGELAMAWIPYRRLASPCGGNCLGRPAVDGVLKSPMRLPRNRRLPLALSLFLLTGVACSASEAVQYPFSIPSGCFALAQREGYPTMISSRWEGLKARAKLARMRSSDPLVRQCKEAVAQAVADHRR